VCIRVGRFLTKILILNESTLGIYSFLWKSTENSKKNFLV
jgi:hypothetical protein